MGLFFLNYVLVIAPGHRFLSDICPTWYAVRAVIEGRDPYSPEVTRDIQNAIYGEGNPVPRNQQRFAYPLFAIVPAVLLGLVSFSVAQQICLWGGIGFAGATAWLWCRCVGYKFDLVLCAWVLAALPISLGILLRQPTVLYLFLLALAAFLFKTERYVLSGLVAALASAKPQLALFVLAPLLVLTLAGWKRRKGFVTGYGFMISALVGLSFILQPNWIQEWVAAMRAYQNYGYFIEFYNLALFLPVYLWLLANRERAGFLFIVPTSTLGGSYLALILSCIFPGNSFLRLTPVPLFFLTGMILAIETPVIGYLIWRDSREREAEETLHLFAHSS